MEKEINQKEGGSQEYKKYHWPITNPNIIFHIVKTIIGFLNSQGGIVYIGIFEEKDKKNKVCGIKLAKKNIREFL